MHECVNQKLNSAVKNLKNVQTIIKHKIVKKIKNNFKNADKMDATGDKIVKENYFHVAKWKTDNFVISRKFISQTMKLGNRFNVVILSQRW